MSLELLSSIKEELIDRKNKITSGGINCLPFPFQRFRKFFPGTDQGRYIVVTGATKSAKTQVTNYIFIYNTVLYYYQHPEVIRAKIFFFPLEETKEQITLRFISYLLFFVSKGKIRISPLDLNSTDERKPVPQEVLDLMDSKEFTDIFKIYEEIVTFYEDKNPTGIYKTMLTYAESHGKITKRHIKFTEIDAWGNKVEKEKEVFDKYIPDDPDEYVIVVVDHIGLLSVEKDLGSLKATIEKLSEYFILLRNRFHYVCVAVQQQNTETTNLEAFKANKIRPTKDGLKDSKRTGEDCDLLIGMTNPNAFDLPDYLGYPIRDAFKNNIRFLEIVLNRKGEANTICPLFFDGAINDFRELPLPSDKDNLDKVLSYIKKLRNSDNQVVKPVLYISTKKLAKKRLHNSNIFSKFATQFHKNILKLK